MFKKHLTRLLSLVFMVLISVGFISGIGSSKDLINHSLTDYYKANNLSDFIIRSASPQGFTGGEISAVENLFPEADIEACVMLDVKLSDERSLRLYFVDFENWNVNRPDIVEGAFPTETTQAVAERADRVIKGFPVGETVDLTAYGMPVQITVGGSIQSPLTFALEGEPSDYNEITKIPETTSGTQGMNCLENILYLPISLAQNLPLGYNYLSVAVKDRSRFSALSDGYKSFVSEQSAAIEQAVKNSKVITLFENYSFMSLKAYGEKVENIGYVLMVAFLLVTALVVLSTMTRLLEEERSQVACLKTLGYSSFGIVSKYLLFALIATGIGGAGAYFVGLGLSRLIYFVFNYSFTMPPVSSHVAILFYILTLALIVLATLATTAIAGLNMANGKPANLLRPKPPKSGKKVIFERIPFLWNKLPFRYKSTVRNVLRYKSRFFMTVIAVAFSTALVLTGLALLDLCLFHDFGSAAIMGIAVVIIIFAGLLTAVVIYTLTNINISERNREIATLMVLGYQNGEVAGYIYREIYINSLIGVIFGYPVSLFLIWLVFSVMAYGSISILSWFTWLIAPVLVFLFTGLVTLILRRKIVKIDMNESLKAIE